MCCVLITLNTIISVHCYLLLRLDLKRHRHNNATDYQDHILLCTNHPKKYTIYIIVIRLSAGKYLLNDYIQWISQLRIKWIPNIATGYTTRNGLLYNSIDTHRIHKYFPVMISGLVSVLIVNIQNDISIVFSHTLFLSLCPGCLNLTSITVSLWPPSE